MREILQERAEGRERDCKRERERDCKRGRERETARESGGSERQAVRGGGGSENKSVENILIQTVSVSFDVSLFKKLHFALTSCHQPGHVKECREMSERQFWLQ